MMVRIILTIVIFTVTIWMVAMEFERYRLRACETKPEIELATQQPGCIGDWVSGGTYCNREFVDIHGNPYYVNSRAY